MATETSPNEGELGIVERSTLEKMKKVELARLANQLYSLRLSPEKQDRREMIDQIISAAHKFRGNSEMLVVNENDTTTEVPKGYVKIKVSPGEHNKSNRPVIVGLNFRMASIPVNRDIIMPGKWISCLQDAVERKPVISRDDHGDDVLEWTDQHKHPYTLLVDNR